MSRLTIVVDLHPSVNPWETDPHEPAQDIVTCFNEWAEANGVEPADFVRAYWGSPPVNYELGVQ